MLARTNYRVALVAVLSLALGLRLVAAVWWQQRLGAPDKVFFGDSYSYWNLARVVAEGGPYSYADSRIFRAPGYPLLLAPLFWLREMPPLVWARYLGACLGTAAVLGVVILAQQMFGRRAGLLAGLLAALYPGGIGMSIFLLSEAPFCPFMLGQLICWVAAGRTSDSRKRVGLAAAGGCLAGLANLIRPSWVLFTPLAAVLALALGRTHRRQFVIAMMMLLTTSLTMLPWWVRNYRVVGTFVPTTLEIGASLYDGLNPQATGSSDMDFVPTFRQRVRAQGELAGGEAYEVRLNQAMRSESLAWAREHPRRVLELALIKFARMWSPWPNAEELQSIPVRLATAAGYLPLLLCGLWGAIQFRQLGWARWLCLLPAGYFTLLHVIFVSSIRYRQPAMLPMIALAAGCIAHRIWRTEVEAAMGPRLATR